MCLKIFYFWSIFEFYAWSAPGYFISYYFTPGKISGNIFWTSFCKNTWQSPSKSYAHQTECSWQLMKFIVIYTSFDKRVFLLLAYRRSYLLTFKNFIIRIILRMNQTSLSIISWIVILSYFLSFSHCFKILITGGS